MEDFEPKILVFACNWCSYAGADLAGTSRIQYTPNIRIVRVMCSGMVNPAMILYAFKKGVDGVVVAGCHPGDCHYNVGNYYAKKRIVLLKELLEFVGFDSERLMLIWASAAEGKKFAEEMTKFAEKIKQLGPQKKFRR
ncbi:F420-non-reducing hydrogenase subunit D [Archaeoglobus sulfaticallidus PM70-1]|uniref:F420-non-reducing hydrogenase subunit D n=1 Tax=Archaeoglobus sulfaticallidus PM70-1 TaxID=387631 RepID=N0BFH9_9EURY|nr:hydrogenase iron-sulfur subunit [Archaeoglobus sulfaticallidus]AGK61788.1 F420-non-reducing hydrogenase subunit D [Archaeoglobus sulfaticallidus PM70-1]